MSHENMSLDHLALQVKGHYIAMGKAEAKVEEHATAAGLYLIECRKRLNLIPKASRPAWAAWVTANCHVSKSKSYELIAIAEGKVTAQEITIAKSQSAMRSREAAVELQKAAAFAEGAASVSTRVDKGGPTPLRTTPQWHQSAQSTNHSTMSKKEELDPVKVRAGLLAQILMGEARPDGTPAMVARVLIAEAIKSGLDRDHTLQRNPTTTRHHLRQGISNLRSVLDAVDALLGGVEDMDRAA